MADEYIRREEMLDAVEELNIIPSIDGMGKPTPTEDFRVQFLGTVLHVPPADVVPVVRCRSCLHFDSDSHFCFLIKGYMRYDDFCSYGKTR